MATGLVVRGGADGIFGQQTRTAVLVYQRVNGLPQTGIVDEATARMLGLLTAGPAAGGGAGSGGGSTASGFASYDERGARVVALQKALLRAGISFTGGADGMFGSATAGAVMKFQRARGLRVTGKVDQATAAALGLQGLPTPAPAPAVNVTLQAQAARQGPMLVRRHVAGGTRQRTGPPRRRHRRARGHSPASPSPVAASPRSTTIDPARCRATV